MHKISGKCQPEISRVRPLGIHVHRQQLLVPLIAFTEKVQLAVCMDEDDIDFNGFTVPKD